MFFYASKIIGFCLYPSNVIAILCVAGLLLIAINKWTKSGRRMLVSAVALLLIAGLSPLGSILILPLEQRFESKTPEDLSAPPTGIILLGGAVTSSVSANRKRMTLNSSGERVTEFLELAKRFPNAKLVFTGGSASVIYKKYPEADQLKKYYQALGLNMSRLILEDRSRNTHENAVFTKDKIAPKPGDRWLLVTSAYHMPRSVGCFRAAGFDVTPYPVDFRTSGWQDSTTLFENVSNGLRRTDIAMREWIGLLAYWLTGRIPSLFPGPK